MYVVRGQWRNTVNTCVQFRLCNMYLLIDSVCTRISDCECSSGTGLSLLFAVVHSYLLLFSSYSLYPSIFPYLPPTLSIFSLPALDLFLLPLSIFSWVFPFFSSLPVLERRPFLGILSSIILSRWPNQLILCPFIHFTVFSPLLISASSRFVRLFHSPCSYLGPYILLNIFLSKISRTLLSMISKYCYWLKHSGSG